VVVEPPFGYAPTGVSQAEWERDWELIMRRTENMRMYGRMREKRGGKSDTFQVFVLAF